MKKAMVFCLLLITVMLISGAQAATSGDWGYKVLPDNTVEITKYYGTAKNLRIPETIEGLVVSKLGDQAFLFSHSLTSVTIPDSITQMGDNPFLVCMSLTEFIVSPDHPTLAVIDNVLFDKVKKELISYPAGNRSSMLYVIPEGIRSVGNRAFDRCNVKNVVLPNTLTSIGNYAFSMCLLESITIPNGVEHIGEYAFASCQITEVKLPDCLAVINKGTFSNCHDLISVVFPKKLKKISADAFSKCSRLGFYGSFSEYGKCALPDGIERIESGAFDFCLIRKIYLPDSLQFIASNAFDSGLSEVIVYHDSVGEKWARQKNIVCRYLKSAGQLKYWELFYRIENEDSVVIMPISATETSPTSPLLIPAKISNIPVVVIDDYAFANGQFSEVLFEKQSMQIKEIGDRAFYSCSELLSITIPEGVTTIGAYAFENCTKLASVTLPASVTTIGTNAFSSCPLVVITVPRNSAAALYCNRLGLRYTYADANDWLKN